MKDYTIICANLLPFI